MEKALDSDIQKNATGIIDLDKRLSSHETMCEERWKTCFNRFDDMDKSIGRIETILIGASGSLIAGGAILILAMYNIHVQEKTMELDYSKKDISKSPKAKAVEYDMSVLFCKRGIWYAVMNEVKMKFNSKEEAIKWLEK